MAVGPTFCLDLSISIEALAFLPLVPELNVALGGRLALPGDLVAEREGEATSSVEAEKDLEPPLTVEARFGVDPLFPPLEIGSLDIDRLVRMLPLRVGLVLFEKVPLREGDIDPV